MRRGIKKFASTKEIHFEYIRNNCRVRLNNPKNLNAITIGMLDEMESESIKWKKQAPCILLLTSDPNFKAFSAGGDIKAVYKFLNEKKLEEAERFFARQYAYDYFFSKLCENNIITCSIWDGIVMGGGVGFSIFSSKILATEKTIFAMPETRIGFFPDMGVMSKLAKLPLGLARAIAICGDRLTGWETYLCGLSDYYITSEARERLEGELMEASGEQLSNTIEQILDKYYTPCPKNIDVKFQEKLEKMHYLFSGEKLEEIYERLQNSPDIEAQKYLQMMDMNSPFWMAVAFEYLQRASNYSVEEVFSTDTHLSKKAVRHPDLFNGIKYLLIEKNRESPPWEPHKLSLVCHKEIVSYFLI